MIDIDNENDYLLYMIYYVCILYIGLTYQQQYKWKEAINSYRIINKAYITEQQFIKDKSNTNRTVNNHNYNNTNTNANHSEKSPVYVPNIHMLSAQLCMESKIRECDLLQGMK